MTTPRILVLNWQDRLNPQAGGAETHLHEVFGRLAARGWDVTLLASGWPGAPARETVDGMDVHRIGGRYSYALHAPRYYASRLGPGRFDLVVEDLNKVPLYSPLWAGRPVVLLVHHLFGATAFREASLPVAAATWLLERPIGLVYRHVPVQAVSESTAGDLARRGIDRRRIVVIPNGIDLEYFSPDPGVPKAGVPTVLYLGRLKAYKRVDIVLRAAAILARRGVTFRLVVAGRGDDAPRLEELRASLGLEDVVEMRGFVSEEEKRDLFRRAWVHVLTSEKEGWGITNLEAAACGTPTVASDSPGLRDSVRDGETGFLVRHGDARAVADRLQWILEDAVLRERLSTGARRFAERFSWERTADATAAHLLAVARRPEEA